MEDGTIVQYIDPEYAIEEDGILTDQDQENQEVNNFENLNDDESVRAYQLNNL